MIKTPQERVEIDADGIKKVLRSFSKEAAIAEYVWNGFDAGANSVSIDYQEYGGLGAVEKITISDDGCGIDYNNLNEKFKPFLSSEKQPLEPEERNSSVIHGKNGFGRLTFFSFAKAAKWSTIYKEGKKLREYSIEIESNSLESFQIVSSVTDASKKITGTSVEFSGAEVTSGFMQVEVYNHLAVEFGWYLELFKNKCIIISGTPLTYETIVGDRTTETVTYSKQGIRFDLSFIRWKKFLKNEHSKYYLLDSKGSVRWRNNTKLNNKGDEFYHSVYVKSSYFDDFTYDAHSGEGQASLIGHNKNDEAFKFIEAEITKFLRNKRRPFLELYVEKQINEYRKEGIIPAPKEEWEIPKTQELTNLIKGLYVIQPKLFTASTNEQKKTFIRLLDVLMDTEEREKILTIIDEVTKLDEDDKAELLLLLKTTSLSSIIRLSKFVEERLRFVDQLKSLVFNKDLKANERDHIQKVMDHHFWIFGEQYNLVSTTEAKFEKALRQHSYILTGNTKLISLDHPDKNKEMDLFLCRQNLFSDRIDNLVIELKSPTVHLGSNEVEQVKKYMSVILSLPECSAANMNWEFILVGNSFSGDYIKNEIENAKSHGEKYKGLIYSVANYKIYVRTWADIFTDFEIRHKHLLERLKIDRDKITQEYTSADDIVVKATKTVPIVKQPARSPQRVKT